jgi:hypothetical protein
MLIIKQYGKLAICSFFITSAITSPFAENGGANAEITIFSPYPTGFVCHQGSNQLTVAQSINIQEEYHDRQNKQNHKT